MNAAIKYRAYDFERKQMCDVLSITLSDLNGRRAGECELNNGHVTFCKNYLKNECALMECTGITDKTGKDIYEGDILEFDKNIWYADQLVYGLKVESLPRVLSEVSFDPLQGWDSYGLPSEWEDYATIVGNIHQNPEMLKNAS